ncbi:hypothetical protein HN865_03725 [Candidatus Woesearchaeota archaeon]|nr:hypothetical protein [Candidatus Woesearchaeota archaeon]
MGENQEIREKIREIILQEYSGPNFFDPLLDKMEEFDKIMNDIHKQILSNQFIKTTVDRDFKNIEKFMDKAYRYMKLAQKAVDDVTS